MMTKRKTSKDCDIWDDWRELWEGKGPDPRIQPLVFYVKSRDDFIAPSEPFETMEGEWSDTFNTMKKAMTAYKKRMKRTKTKQCDIQLHLKFGGAWQIAHKIPRPHFPETWIYLVRWRADGAFLESYHTNTSKFGERDHGRRTNELQNMTKTPGLLSHWVKRAKKEGNK